MSIELEPVHATGFASLTDFMRPRSWPLVLAFYAFYAFIGVIVAGIMAAVFGMIIVGDAPNRTFSQNFTLGMIIGTITSTAYCLSIGLIIVYQRKAWRDTKHLLALLGTIIGGLLLGNIGAMIAPSLLLLRSHSKSPADTPR